MDPQGKSHVVVFTVWLSLLISSNDFVRSCCNVLLLATGSLEATWSIFEHKKCFFFFFENFGVCPVIFRVLHTSSSPKGQEYNCHLYLFLCLCLPSAIVIPVLSYALFPLFAKFGYIKLTASSLIF